MGIVNKALKQAVVFKLPTDAVLNFLRIKLVNDIPNVKIGDMLMIKDNRESEKNDCLTFKRVTEMDDHSFLAGNSINGWWFYKDTLNPYSGDAQIIGIVEDEICGFHEDKPKISETYYKEQFERIVSELKKIKRYQGLSDYLGYVGYDEYEKGDVCMYDDIEKILYPNKE